MKITPGPWKVSELHGNTGVTIDPMNYELTVSGARDPEDDFDLEELANILLMVKAPELLEMLDNVTASLETMLAHFGHQCPAEDHAMREKLARTARKLVDKLYR